MGNDLQLELADETATLALGRRLGRRCRGGERLLLHGPLGAGKTTLVRGLGRGLGIEHGVRSPTFQLLREYRGRLVLYHADLYRLGGTAAEFTELGLWELPGPRGVLAVEWAERGAFPGAHLTVRLSFAGAGRRIMLRDVGGAHGHLLELDTSANLTSTNPTEG
ncbi:MAG: tRNA (adenosine(37)-N6)-threonylcarbamoyltransferase complex ATPase subunit type 1 TsaE [Candidatus Coatesbacteria bacterium]|nr:tRNA (adenosine(37)-N6)-threonylcarbamoyltransferase complex ATPase subunit type 1 TsaE [Candidatus Coatesbacteria bacterium]